MDIIYVVFQMGQFGGVTLHAFKLKSDAEDFVYKLKCSKPKDSTRIERLEVK